MEQLSAILLHVAETGLVFRTRRFSQYCTICIFSRNFKCYSLPELRSNCCMKLNCQVLYHKKNWVSLATVRVLWVLNKFLQKLGWGMWFDYYVHTFALRQPPTFRNETSSHSSKQVTSSSSSLALHLCTFAGVQPWCPVLEMYSNPGMLFLISNMVDLAVQSWSP